jgi:Asp-tRNA(Asn)/Glu-tRNA(Gln) amidotransferase A subunit family amidase
MPNLHFTDAETISGLSQAIRSRQTTCAALVEQCLARIDEWEPRVKAWVSIDRDGALGRARELDAEIARAAWRGPLHGIPVGIKDLIDVAGRPTAAGSTLRARDIAATDAPVVAALREAGAIILGKTVTTQFACFDPPVTKNPWGLERTPGGSSSGSAAAVATGMCLAAVGSQTGGSITRPASFCGVAGCKPSFGRVSVAQVVPLAQTLDHVGPIARCVADLAIMLDAMTDKSAAKPVAPVETCSDAVHSSPAPPVLGRLRGLFADRAEPASLKLFEQALDRLAAAGAKLANASLPAAFDDVLPRHRCIMIAEIAALHERRYAEHRDDYLPRLSGLIEEGLKVPAVEYVRARDHQSRLKADMAESFAGCDVLICPATVGPAPDASTTGDPSFNAPWSYTGLPTVSVPFGLHPDGLPLSLQLVGRPGNETTLFRAAAWCETIVANAS